MALKQNLMGTIWQKKGSWRMEHIQLTAPDGRSADSLRIVHPGSVVLIPLTAEGNVVMIRQYRLPINQVILEVPAGTKEWDEDSEICAQRELREETGYRAKRFDLVCKFWPGPALADELMHLYIARDLTHDPLPMDFDEEIETAEIPLDELVAMALDGRMQDGKSIVAILRAHAWLTNEKTVRD